MNWRAHHRFGWRFAATAVVVVACSTTQSGRGATQHDSRAGAPRDRLVYADGVEGIAAALDSFPIVALADLHGAAELGAFRRRLLADDRVLDRVQDVVIEAGNSLYQPLADRYVRGDSVSPDSLRLIWNNTTQSPLNTLDAPLYAQDILRTVREANARRALGKRVRVLLADPPIEWGAVTTLGDFRRFLSQRRVSHVRVLSDSVIARGHRAIFICGGLHLLRTTAGGQPNGPMATTTQRMLLVHPRSVYVILIFDGFGGATSRYEPLMTALPRESLVPFAGNMIASLPAVDVMSATPGAPEGSQLTTTPGAGRDAPSIYSGLALADVADAYLYLLPFSEMTVAAADLSGYRADPARLAELDRRQRIVTGEAFDTASFFAPPRRLLYGAWRGDRNVRRPALPTRPPGG
jgi:hypothetical protein